MSLENRGINRRQFLKAAGAIAGATAVSLNLPPFIGQTEAAAGKKIENVARGLDPKFAELLVFSERSYRINRKQERYFQKLKPALSVIPQDTSVHGQIISGKLGRFGVEGTPEKRRAGRMERSLRFKNITDAVERRYNLPAGIILAMVMQESSGADMFPNGLDDGGFGLCHMQPSVAQQFGMVIYGDSNKLRDKKHGKELRYVIQKQGFDVFKLTQYDDRLNRLLNLDAVGRILATYMGGQPIKGKAPLETAIMRYSGRHNYRKYLGNLKRNMRDLRNTAYITSVASAFDIRNTNLSINKIPVGKSGSAFSAYIQAFWQENRAGFQLDKYVALQAFEPNNSSRVLASYPDILLADEKPKKSLLERARESLQKYKKK